MAQTGPTPILWPILPLVRPRPRLAPSSHAVFSLGSHGVVGCTPLRNSFGSVKRVPVLSVYHYIRRMSGAEQRVRPGAVWSGGGVSGTPSPLG